MDDPPAVVIWQFVLVSTLQRLRECSAAVCMLATAWGSVRCGACPPRGWIQESLSRRPCTSAGAATFRNLPVANISQDAPDHFRQRTSRPLFDTPFSVAQPEPMPSSRRSLEARALSWVCVSQGQILKREPETQSALGGRQRRRVETTPAQLPARHTDQSTHIPLRT